MNRENKKNTKKDTTKPTRARTASPVRYADGRSFQQVQEPITATTARTAFPVCM